MKHGSILRVLPVKAPCLIEWSWVMAAHGASSGPPPQPCGLACSWRCTSEQRAAASAGRPLACLWPVYACLACHAVIGRLRHAHVLWTESPLFSLSLSLPPLGRRPGSLSLSDTRAHPSPSPPLPQTTTFCPIHHHQPTTATTITTTTTHPLPLPPVPEAALGPPRRPVSSRPRAVPFCDRSSFAPLLIAPWPLRSHGPS